MAYGSYQTTNPRAVHNPLRSIPLFRPASALRQFIALPAMQPAPAKAPPTLAALEARHREAVRLYDGARAAIGQANRTTTAPIVAQGRIVMAGLRLTADQVRARKSAAFREFNQRRREMGEARRPLDAARVDAGLLPLVVGEGRAAVKADLQNSKRRHYAARPARLDGNLFSGVA